MATKTYGDRRKAHKEPCVTAATTNIDVSAPGATIGGVTMATAENKRVLLAGQTDAAENGIYEWTAADAPLLRAEDANSTEKVRHGVTVPVTGGTGAGVYVAGPCASLGTTSVTYALSTADTAGILATLSSNSNGDGASLIGIEDAIGAFDATDVEGALAEIAAVVGPALGDHPLVSQHVRTVINASALDVASTSTAISCGTLPAGAILRAVLVDLVTAFEGGSVSAVTVEVGNAGAADDYVTATNVFTGVAAGRVAAVLTPESVTADTEVLATFTVTDDNLDQLTDGSLAVHLVYDLVEIEGA